MRVAVVLLLLGLAVAAVTASPTAAPSNCHKWCRRPHQPRHYCCVRPGECPKPREGDSCTVGADSSDFDGPSLCDDDGDCATSDKCCLDSCVGKKVCKTKVK